MRRRLFCLIVISTALSACTTGIYSPTVPTAQRPSTGAAAGAPSGAANGAGPVVGDRPAPLAGPTAALLGQSRDERDAGDLDAAAATIERALSIAPNEAVLWVELAEIYFEQGDLDRAEEMARKALTLTPAGTPEAERARRLVSR